MEYRHYPSLNHYQFNYLEETILQMWVISVALLIEIRAQLQGMTHVTKAKTKR